MTESQRTTSEQEKPKVVGTDSLLEHSEVAHSEVQRPTSSSPVGVYEQATPTRSSSSNMMWIILLIVLVIVAFFILRQWM